MAASWSSNKVFIAEANTPVLLKGVAAIENKSDGVIFYSKTPFASDVEGFSLRPREAVGFRTAGEDIWVLSRVKAKTEVAYA